MKLFRFVVLSLACSFAFTLALAGNAHAANGARTVKYSPTDVIPIRAKVRFSTLIVLPADEEILDFTTGDKEFWIINGAHNLCYLHPAQAGIRSNLNLVTASGHVYSFLLTEISKEKEADSEADLKVFVTPNGDIGSEFGTSLGTSGTGIPGSIPPAKYVRASEADAYKNELAALRNQLAEEQKRSEEQSRSGNRRLQAKLFREAHLRLRNRQESPTRSVPSLRDLPRRRIHLSQVRRQRTAHDLRDERRQAQSHQF